jgi:sporulation-control protein spo0M
MKNLGLLFAFNLYQVVSCKNNESEKIDEVLKVPAEKPISVGCYQAIYEEDTLDLKINTFKMENNRGYGYGNF